MSLEISNSILLKIILSLFILSNIILHVKSDNTNSILSFGYFDGIDYIYYKVENNNENNIYILY